MDRGKVPVPAERLRPIASGTFQNIFLKNLKVGSREFGEFGEFQIRMAELWARMADRAEGGHRDQARAA